MKSINFRQKNHRDYWEMVKNSVIACILLGFLLLMSAPAWGSTGHDHIHKGDSPFEKNSNEKSNHCLLNKHSHQGQVCPHALLLVQKNKDGIFLSTECGGNPHGQGPVNNIFNHNPFTTNSYDLHSPLNFLGSMNSKIFLHLFLLQKSLDHPPKNV